MGIYPEDTETIFQYQTGNETTFHYSFCQDGYWTEFIPLNSIKMVKQNYQVL